MDTTEAIKQLKKLKSDKQQQSADNQSNAFAKSLNTFKNLLIGAMSDLTALLLKNEPSVKVLNFPSNKKIEKQIDKMNVTLEKILLCMEKRHTEPLVKSVNLNKEEKESTEK